MSPDAALLLGSWLARLQSARRNVRDFVLLRASELVGFVASFSAFGGCFLRSILCFILDFRRKNILYRFEFVFHLQLHFRGCCVNFVPFGVVLDYLVNRLLGC